MPADFKKLSKTIALALRHKPWLFELELDVEGWTAVDDLLEALHRSRPMWEGVTQDHLATMIAQMDKQRYEMANGKIRALYGHSLAAKIEKVAAVPPEILYHGTTDRVLALILRDGLKPMSRQYVHFSVDEETAAQVGRRKQGALVVLQIEAASAHDNDITFYRGNEIIWLADCVPPEYIYAPEEKS